MNEMIRPAQAHEVEAVAQGYERLFDREEQTGSATNWRRGVYPTRATAQNAFEKGWLYVLLDDAGCVCASMILNHEQPQDYARLDWRFPAGAEETLVLHTLCVDPAQTGRGYGSRMVRFLLEHARRTGMRAVRLDTYEGNAPAAGLYRRLGFRYAGSLEMLHEGVIPETLICFEIAVGNEDK